MRIKNKKERIPSYRKYSVNENYFAIIDSEEKAYFLGLLYADGCNYEERYTITVNLQEDDKDILEKFRIALNQNKPLLFCKKWKPTWKNQYKLIVNSKIMSKRLIELGCFGAKSLTLKFPTEEQVPKHLMRYFLRGLWDGDGNFCYYFVKAKPGPKMTSCIATSECFCDELNEFLKKELSINSSILSRKTTIAKTLQISGRKQVMRFIDWLYKDSKIHLNRKFIKYQEIKNENSKYSESLLKGKTQDSNYISGAFSP